MYTVVLQLKELSCFPNDGSNLNTALLHSTHPSRMYVHTFGAKEYLMCVVGRP